MSNFRDLLEQIREQDSVQVPDIVKFNVEYLAFYSLLVKIVF